MIDRRLDRFSQNEYVKYEVGGSSTRSVRHRSIVIIAIIVSVVAIFLNIPHDPPLKMQSCMPDAMPLVLE